LFSLSTALCYRRSATDFLGEHRSSCRRDAGVDRLQQCVIEQGDVVPQGLMAEDLGVSPTGTTCGQGTEPYRSQPQWRWLGLRDWDTW
jgi:hypothetical protein